MNRRLSELSPEERDALQQELLELCFDCHPDPDGLRRRIAGDAELQALFAQTLSLAQGLTVAANETVDTPRFRAPEEGSLQSPDGLDGEQAPSRDDVAARRMAKTSRRSSPRQSFVTTAVRIAASLLLLALLAPFADHGYRRFELNRAQNSTLRLVVSGPRSIPDAAPARFHVETWNAVGEAQPASLTWSAFDIQNQLLASGAQATSGALDIDLPPHKTAPARIELVAQHEGREETLVLPLNRSRNLPLIHLSSDKPAYRPGEVVRTRAALLERLSFAPMEGAYRLRITDPRGTPVVDQVLQSDRGVIATDWAIPDGASGGRYQVEIRDRDDQFTAESLEFLVRRFQPPRLAQKIELLRESYAPGESGNALVNVARVDGTALTAASVRGCMLIDGVERWSATQDLAPDGTTLFRFTIPEAVERGEARFVACSTADGIVETVLEPFVVQTGAVDVQFHPEGGDLIAGFENRVYVEVTDPLGRFADARGDVVDANGNVVASFATEHQGRGRFHFTPQSGTSYRIVLESPKRREFALPAVLDQGAVLRSVDASTPADAPLLLSVDTQTNGPWICGVFCRGVLVAEDTFSGAGRHDLSLRLPETVAGVLRVTLFNQNLRPLAERLVHKESGRRLLVEITPSQGRLLPGGRQALDIRTTDETGRPVQTTLGLCVSDRALRDMIDEPRVGIEDQAWLLADCEKLEDLDEFLARDDAARQRIDLLLGTRGWRRFAWNRPQELVAAHGDRARRLLAMESRPQVPQVGEKVTDSAGLRSAQAAVRSSWKRCGRAMALAALTAVLAVMFLGYWWILKRFSTPRRWAPVHGGLLTLATAAAVVVCVGPMLMDLRDASAPAAELRAIGYVGPGAGFKAEGELDVVAILDDVVDGIGDFAIDYIDNSGSDPEGLGDFFAAAQWGTADTGLWLASDIEGIENAVILEQKPDNLDGFRFESKQKIGDFLYEDPRDELERRARQRSEPFRIYAHSSARQPDGTRRDFTETVYWHPLLTTSVDGIARVEFDVSDRVTTWQASANAHGSGRIGQASREFPAVPPFHVEAKLPLHATIGDRLQIPVTIECLEQGCAAAKVRVEVSGAARLIQPVAAEVALEEGAARLWIPVEIVQRTSDPPTAANATGASNRTRSAALNRESPSAPGAPAMARIEVHATSGEFTDRVVQEFPVERRGFPHAVTLSGRLDSRVEFMVGVPEQFVEGSLEASVQMFPSPLADLLRGLDGLLREPCGCFEQASSSNYPNVLALGFMQATDSLDATVMARARRLLDSGYRTIAGYECTERGYEWFGQDPGHETLTAYGVLEFHDMAAVHAVDADMVARTRAWLLSRRDGSGGFQRNPRALDSFGSAPQAVCDAYIGYALAVTGESPNNLDSELARMETRALESDDAYETALCAGALHAAGRTEAAAAARERLKTMQKDDGSLCGSTTSITCSGGKDLAIETTAFAILAWLDDPGTAAHVQRGVEYLLENRSSGGTFGATQATIMALKALTRYAQQNHRVARAGEVRVLVNDQCVGTQSFEAGRRDSLVLTGLEEFLRPGAQRIALEISGGNVFPYLFELYYHSELPADDPDCKLAIETRFGQPAVDEGKPLTLRVDVTNLTDQGLPMTLARIGIPGNLELPTKELDALRKAGCFDLWELRGSDLVLYWRCLEPAARKQVEVQLFGRIQGTARGTSSRVWLYYTPFLKRWAAPLEVCVESELASAREIHEIGYRIDGDKNP